MIMFFYTFNSLDSEAPSIRCPNVPQYTNEENTNYRNIDLMDAKASDNSNLPVKITMSHSSPLKVVVGTPIVVTYTAVDAIGNEKKCRSTYTVIGRCYTHARLAVCNSLSF